MSTETPRLVPVMDGSACAGFLISLGPRGVEAFDQDEKPLGVFPDAISAAAAVKKSVVPGAAKRVLGVDPGIRGGLAVVDITTGPPRAGRGIDIPVDRHRRQRTRRCRRHPQLHRSAQTNPRFD